VKTLRISQEQGFARKRKESTTTDPPSKMLRFAVRERWEERCLMPWGAGCSRVSGFLLRAFAAANFDIGLILHVHAQQRSRATLEY
jgi:hypothetical protein